MTDELKQNFDSGIIKHLHFKSKLRSSLYGSDISQGPIRDPAQCAFGHWIRDQMLGPYAHLPEWRELERLHVLIHRQANHLMDLHKQGDTEPALAGLPAVELLADRITGLLDTMQQKLRAAQ